MFPYVLHILHVSGTQHGLVTFDPRSPAQRVWGAQFLSVICDMPSGGGLFAVREQTTVVSPPQATLSPTPHVPMSAFQRHQFAGQSVHGDSSGREQMVSGTEQYLDPEALRRHWAAQGISHRSDTARCYLHEGTLPAGRDQELQLSPSVVETQEQLSAALSLNRVLEAALYKARTELQLKEVASMRLQQHRSSGDRQASSSHRRYGALQSTLRILKSVRNSGSVRLLLGVWKAHSRTSCAARLDLCLLGTFRVRTIFLRAHLLGWRSMAAALRQYKVSAALVRRSRLVKAVRLLQVGLLSRIASQEWERRGLGIAGFGTDARTHSCAMSLAAAAARSRVLAHTVQLLIRRRSRSTTTRVFCAWMGVYHKQSAVLMGSQVVSGRILWRDTRTSFFHWRLMSVIALTRRADEAKWRVAAEDAPTLMAELEATEQRAASHAGLEPLIRRVSAGPDGVAVANGAKVDEPPTHYRMPKVREPSTATASPIHPFAYSDEKVGITGPHPLNESRGYSMVPKGSRSRAPANAQKSSSSLFGDAMSKGGSKQEGGSPRRPEDILSMLGQQLLAKDAQLDVLRSKLAAQSRQYRRSGSVTESNSSIPSTPTSFTTRGYYSGSSNMSTPLHSVNH